MRQRRRPRQPEAQRAEVIFQAFAAFGTAMHGDARRFVDHQHQAVAIKEPRHHFSSAVMSSGGMVEPLSRTAPTTTVQEQAPLETAMDDRSADTTQTTAAWWQRLATGLKRSSSALGGA